MRINSNVKIHEVKGPRLPYLPREAEVRENEYKYLITDGIAVLDGEGILYWVDTIVTTDAGGSIVYDNNAASGRGLSAAYGVKADDGMVRSWNPPKRYFHGVYVNLTTSLVEICYKPLARNLRCTVDVDDTRTPLYSRVTVRCFEDGTSLPSYLYGKLVSRVEVEREGVGLELYTKNLVSRVMVLNDASKNMVVRVTVQLSSYGFNLVCRLYADRTP